MSRWRTPSLNSGIDFKKGNKLKELANHDAEDREHRVLDSKTLVTSEDPKFHPPRIRTLAQVTTAEVPKVKEELKSMLPKLTAVEVRRFRIPYHEAMILELQEEGLRDSAEYMMMLFKLEEEIRIKDEPDSIMGKKPRLKNHKNFLDRLRTGLTGCEVAKKSGNLIAQTAALIDAALYFESENSGCFWIAEELFKRSLTIAENIKDDEGQNLNTIRYLYGRFILNKMKDYQRALHYLGEVRENSKGKLWNASKILGYKQNTLYRESCNLLHKVLMTLTHQVRNEDPKLSVKAAKFALEQATNSVTDDYISAALYKLGKSQLSAGNIEEALRNLSKFLAIAKRIPDPEGVCNAHKELAFAYKELEDSEGTVKHLGLLQECATRFKLPYKLAQAHYYTGEFLLNKSQASLATPHLELACNLFSELNKTAEANRARCIAGVSKGQEVIDQYIDLILNCTTQNFEANLKICQWKNKRIPFWASKEISNCVIDKSVDNRNDAKYNSL